MGSIRHILNSPAPILVALLLLAGCKTEKDPEDPTILGLPPQTAYLGVDYSYNFGTFGGDNLLNYTLSGAPSWMALEATENKARKGIVLRGQPGISGGRRGEADLGKSSFIRITSNDGELLGDSGFQVEVKHNALRVQSATVREGEAYIPASVNGNGNGNDEMCELPDMDEVGEVAVQHRRLASGPDGSFEENVPRTYSSYPILIEVELDQPSVEPVVVKFELRDNFDPDFDGTDDTPNCPELDADDRNSELPCEYRSGNRARAIYGEDFRLNSGALSDPPDYLRYLEEPDPADHTGRRATGLLTFEPGITRCFIRAEVFDDQLAEQRESFTVELLEVVDGLASVRENGGVRRGTINIDDNAPLLELSPEEITLSRNQTIDVTATLNMENPFEGEELVARIQRRPDRGNNDDESTAGDDDFTLTYTGSNGIEQSGNSIVIGFPYEEDKVTFQLKIENLTDPSAAGAARKLDELLQIVVDPIQQFGREFAVAGEDAELGVYINEWKDSHVIEDYEPTDIVSGSYGELYLAGIQGNDGIFLESINRFGDTDANADDTDVLIDETVTGDGDVRRPVVTFRDRNIGTTGSPQLRRDLALAFTTDGIFENGASTNASDNIALAFLRSVVEEEGNNLEMAELWRMQVGSDGDDRVEQIALGSTSRLFLGGMTEGNWDDPGSGESQIHRGNGDILLSAFDTLQEGEDFEGSRLWTKVVGSIAADVFAGISVAGRGELNMLGSTGGEAISGSSVGGEDFLYNSADQTGRIFREAQFGTTRDDRFSHAALSSRNLWGIGASLNRYRFDLDGRLPRLERSADEAGNESPYVMVMDSLGNPRNVITLESESDIANQTVSAVQADGPLLYLAGETDGAFAEDFEGEAGGYLAVVRYDEGENEIEEKWRIQIPDINRVISMSLHDSRKIFLLVENDSGTYEVRLYNAFGNLLTE